MRIQWIRACHSPFGFTGLSLAKKWERKVVWGKTGGFSVLWQLCWKTCRVDLGDLPLRSIFVFIYIYMLFYILYHMWIHCQQKACIMLEDTKKSDPSKTPSSTWDHRCSRSLGHHCRWDSAAARDVFGIHQWWGANSGGKMSCAFFSIAFQMKPVDIFEKE